MLSFAPLIHGPFVFVHNSGNISSVLGTLNGEMAKVSFSPVQPNVKWSRCVGSYTKSGSSSCPGF